MYKKVLYYICVTLAFFILLYLINDAYQQLQIARQETKTPLALFTFMTIYGILFGILIESKCLLLLFKSGLHVNWLMIVSLVLLIITFIPNSYWVIWFGANTNFLIQILIDPGLHMLFAVLSGILLIRSLGRIEY